MKQYRRKTQRGIWETDVRMVNIKNPRALAWYVEKKISVGDWEAIDRKTLATLLPTLKIAPSLRGILERFLST